MCTTILSARIYRPRAPSRLMTPRPSRIDFLSAWASGFPCMTAASQAPPLLFSAPCHPYTHTRVHKHMPTHTPLRPARFCLCCCQSSIFSPFCQLIHSSSVFFQSRLYRHTSKSHNTIHLFKVQGSMVVSIFTVTCNLSQLIFITSKRNLYPLAVTS